MGAGSSTPVTAEAAAHEKAVLERIRSLSLDGDEYVGIEADSVGEKGDPAFVHYQPEGLPAKALDAWAQNVLEDPKNKLALTAFQTADPRQVLTYKQPSDIVHQEVWNVKIPFEGGPVTNQRSSGRCWLFASTNVFRVALMKKHNLESFELSQAYLFYWDKLEKANWFLEQIIATAGKDLEGRLVQELLKNLVSDGGQWDMVYNLVEKYGLVPQALYPDSWSAKNSSVLNKILKTRLREYGLRLRKLALRRDVSAAAVSAAKISMMRQISLIMTLALGAPPSPDKEFTWQYTDKDGKAREVRASPKEFARDISSSDFRITSSVIEGMVSLVHDPRHKPLQLLTVDRLGNIVGGRDITYINVPMDTLKEACVKMLKAGLPVFFGCDVGQGADGASGMMDLDLVRYELAFGGSSQLSGLTKEERLATGESQMTHAMVLTAVHIDEGTGRAVRWRVQNSWGEDAGDKGFFVMTDAWMDEFVYQAVVDPRFLSKEVTDVLKKEPVVLPLWDPMGSLA